MFYFLKKLLQFVRIHDITMYKMDVNLFYDLITISFIIIVIVSIISHITDYSKIENFNAISLITVFVTVTVASVLFEFIIYCILIQLPIVFFGAFYLNFYILRFIERASTWDGTLKSVVRTLISNYAKWVIKKLSFKAKQDNSEIETFNKQYQQKLNFNL